MLLWRKPAAGRQARCSPREYPLSLRSGGPWCPPCPACGPRSPEPAAAHPATADHSIHPGRCLLQSVPLGRLSEPFLPFSPRFRRLADADSSESARGCAFYSRSALRCSGHVRVTWYHVTHAADEHAWRYGGQMDTARVQNRHGIYVWSVTV